MHTIPDITNRQTQSVTHAGSRGGGTGPISLARQQEASSRLTSELRAIALDMLGLYESEELPPDCAAWVRSTVEAAVAGICGPAVAAVARHLRAELAAAPADIVRRIDQAKRRHEVGFA